MNVRYYKGEEALFKRDSKGEVYIYYHPEWIHAVTNMFLRNFEVMEILNKKPRKILTKKITKKQAEAEMVMCAVKCSELPK